MPKEKIRGHPFAIILFMATDNRLRRVRVVITYSITHFLAGHVQRDPLAEWCTFTWYSGLTDVEYEKYSKSTFAQRGMEFATTLAELTGKYPLELYRVELIIEDNPKITNEELYRHYIRQVTTYLETKTTEFITAGLQSQIPNFLVLAGTPVLLAGIKKVTVHSASPTYMDGRFFFVNNDNDIQALTPTFATILLSIWIKALELSTTNLNPHIVGLMTQDKNCAGSLIDVLMRERTKNNIVDLFITHLDSGHFRGIKSRPKFIEFHGDSLPTSKDVQSETWDKDVLLLPISKTYRGVDFFLWLAASDEMLAFQVTVGKKHTDSFVERTSHEMEQNELAPMQLLENHLHRIGKMKAQIKVVWVVTEMMPETKWVKRGDYFCHLAALHYLHPLVRDYSFAELGRLSQTNITVENLPSVLNSLKTIWLSKHIKWPTPRTLLLINLVTSLSLVIHLFKS
eukprot:TRINITY_DN3620_c1_g1_i3.p1 TRINITY_DN3620_c1_g1~~TRINITY_DN3620_c1_g1_i3.p1  ORF type:complete len:455 (-),score=63.49 TRINITY_DN3620_c1_g1_i3:244-1608(-)